MRTILRTLLLALTIGTAHAQVSGGVSNPAPPPYKLSNGVAYQAALFIGPGAGSAAPSSMQFGGVGFGQSSLQSLNTSGTEPACGGSFSCQFVTNAYAVTGWGEHVIGFDNSSYVTCTGNDCMRDTIGATNSTGNGAQSQRDGVGNTNTSLGAFSLQGNAGSIQILGALTTGDRICLPFSTTNGNVTGLPASACYTVAGGDTLLSVATALASAISALNVTYTLPSGNTTATENGVSLGAFVANGNEGTVNGIIGLHFPGGNATGWAITPGTPTCTGTCSETFAVLGPFSGVDDIAIGANALFGINLTSGSRDFAAGDGALASLAGTSSDIYAIGSNAGNSAVTGNSSFLGGTIAAKYATTIYKSVIIGDAAASGSNATNLQYVTIIGANNSNQSCVQTAQGVLELGYGACAPSPTNNWGGSIMDAIFITNANHGGGGGSYGQIGLGGQKAPGAVLDILGPDTSSTLAFRIQSSAPGNLFSVADNGVIAVGGGAFTANGTTAATLTALAPAGAHATVQEWFTVTDTSGNVRYIPAF